MSTQTQSCHQGQYPYPADNVYLVVGIDMAIDTAAIHPQSRYDIYIARRPDLALDAFRVTLPHADTWACWVTTLSHLVALQRALTAGGATADVQNGAWLAMFPRRVLEQTVALMERFRQGDEEVRKHENYAFDDENREFDEVFARCEAQRTPQDLAKIDEWMTFLRESD